MSQVNSVDAVPSKGQAGVDPYSVPLDKIDVSDSELFETDTHWGYFERLRKEDPVHYCAESDFGPYWSITRFNDIMTVEKDPDTYSSEGSIVIGDLRQIPYDFTAGTTQRLFDVGAHPMGTVICYESAYPRLVREFVQEGAELLVVSTSDRSYGRSGIAAAHFAVAQMRAAETGRPVLQAAISGVSGVIDADGDARDLTGLFETTITEGRVITRSGETPYVRFGDWVLAVCGLGMIVVAIVGAGRRARAS